MAAAGETTGSSRMDQSVSVGGALLQLVQTRLRDDAASYGSVFSVWSRCAYAPPLLCR